MNDTTIVKPEEKMWDALTSGCTAIEVEKTMSLLSSHGLVSGEYLSFCDNVLLDELSSSLKSVPRRMFEYYRIKLWQPYEDAWDTVTCDTSKVSRAVNADGYEMNSHVVHRSDVCPAISENRSESVNCSELRTSKKMGNDKSKMVSDLQSSEGLYQISASSVDTSGKTETECTVEKLPTCYGDTTRVPSHECSDELASSCFEILENDVKSGVDSFLESGPMEKQRQPLPQHEEQQTSGKQREQSQICPSDEEIHSHPPQDQQISPPLEETHRVLAIEHQPTLQPRAASKSDMVFVTRILHNYFKSDRPEGAAETRDRASERISAEVPERTALEKQAEEKKRLGNAAMAANAHDEAIRRYSEALELSAAGPNSHIYYSNRAAAHCFLKNYERAVEDCEAAIRLRADFAKAYSRLGLCNFYLGSYEASVAAYERLVELEPYKAENLEELKKAKQRLVNASASGTDFSRASELRASSGAASATKNEEVFIQLQQFLDCKRAIEQTWAAISTGRLEHVAGVDTVQLADMSWNFALRQQNLEGSPVDSMDELYEAAEAANPIFQSCMRRIVAAADLPADCLQMAPLKGRVRATEKAKDDYDGRELGHGERWLFDIVRGAVLCDTEDQLTRMIAALQSSSEMIEIVRLKNRFANPTPAGFRDFNLNIRVALPTHHTHHICELQVHCAAIKKMDELKLSHKIYEYFRTYFRGEAKSVDERLKMLEHVGGSLSIGSAGVVSLKAIVEEALTSNSLQLLENVSELLKLLAESEHNIRIKRKIAVLTEEQLGPDHPDTLIAVNNLALWVQNIGERAEARDLYERALRGYETALGPEHPDTLRMVDNLALLLNDLGDRVKAQALHERALRGFEKTLGPEHPSTLDAATNLGNLLYGLGQLSQARALYEQALRRKEKALGPDHPSTLTTINNFASLLEDLGEKEQARALYERAVRGFEKGLGPEHPSTLAAVTNLGISLCSLGQLPQARAVFERALRGWEKAVGPEHPKTLSTVYKLAILLQDLGESEQARALHERAQRGSEKAMDRNAPGLSPSYQGIVPPTWSTY